uniref:proteasome endopeptidase complex n=1 Tax=Acrobeloides nanus TaxID=290746 RepID=A0A914CHS7_9BILA
MDEVLTGTTLIACEYDGGVVVGTDSRTSGGSFIASRVTDKITPVTEHMSILRSGSAADTQAITDIAKYYIETYTVMEGEPVSIYRACNIMRKFLFNYRDQLSASIIVTGYDEKLKGQIYAIPLGGYSTRQHFTASGSGSTFVNGYLDSQWKPDMTFEQVKQLVLSAVYLATFRDGSSGGVIRLAIIDKDGTRRELYRPDANFPQIVADPPAYSPLPPHLKGQAN